jgi:SAM-dependent methyltransferase
VDIRTEAARYYDYSPETPNDIPFYRQRIPSPQAEVLELGCGTGRVTIPLSSHCRSIYGLDLSPEMLSICQAKLERAGIPPSRASVQLGDISAFDLQRQFALIIAPFRVFQNLETDAQVTGLFECVRRHLKYQGTCILNVFRPYADRETIIREWCTDTEKLQWEVPIAGGKVQCFDRRPRLDPEKLILYPELIYRHYQGNQLVNEAILKIPMRCYYPDEFAALIEAHGFRIMNRWGGYAGEEYGLGSELVIEFALDR